MRERAGQRLGALQRPGSATGPGHVAFDLSPTVVGLPRAELGDGLCTRTDQTLRSIGIPACEGEHSRPCPADVGILTVLDPTKAWPRRL